MLTLEQIQEVDDRPEKVVEMPEWGGNVRIKALSVDGVTEATDRARVNGEVDDMKAAMNMVIAGVIEPKLTPESAALLTGKSAAAVTRLVNEISKLSGISADDAKKAEARFPD
jgi:hypothetical protein